jgi:hypothetical protein
MKKPTAVLLTLFPAVALFAQTAPVQTPAGSYPYSGNLNTNELGVGGITFSNRFGQAFSAQDLAAQLQNLRSAVDQALPILTAFNEHFSNSVAGGYQSVGGALSGIVSGVLNRNQASGQNSSAQNSMSATNLLALLHGLLNTNSNGATGASPTTYQDTVTLQNDLQPVATLLQRLVPGAYPNPTGSPYNNPNGTSQNPPLTPTGR